MKSESGDDNPLTSRRGQNTNCFPLSAPRAEKRGNNRRKGGVHLDSAKNLWFTTALSIRALRGDRRHKKNCAGNVNTRLQAGGNSTSQCSPYHIKLRGNGTVGKYDCYHEFHAGATKNTRICKKLTKKGQKESSTAGVAGEMSLTGEKNAQQRKRYIKRKRTTRKGWVAVKRDANDS